MHPYYEQQCYEHNKLPLLIYNLESDSQNDRLVRRTRLTSPDAIDFFYTDDCIDFLHWHSSYEILYYYRDGCSLIVNGELYQPKKGDILLVDAFDIHLTPNESPYGCYVFLFDPSLMQLSSDEVIHFPAFIEHKLIEKDSTYESYRLAIAEKLESLIHLYEVMNYSEKNPVSVFELHAELFHLFARIENYTADVTAKEFDTDIATDNKRTHLKKIYNYVALHYQEEISLKDISDLVGFTENYFCRFIKKSTDQTFFEFLNTYRCHMARLKLERTDTPLTAIALDCGFSSLSYFSKTFKKIFLLSPSIYRQQFHKII